MEGLVLTFLLLYVIVNLCILVANLIVLCLTVKLTTDSWKVQQLRPRVSDTSDKITPPFPIDRREGS